MDDLLSAVCHADLAEAGETLQGSNNKVLKWSDENRFTFSAKKTTAIHFTDKPGIHCTPTLQLGLQNI